jgi:hypothetical protein
MQLSKPCRFTRLRRRTWQTPSRRCQKSGGAQAGALLKDGEDGLQPSPLHAWRQLTHAPADLPTLHGPSAHLITLARTAFITSCHISD